MDDLITTIQVQAAIIADLRQRLATAVATANKRIAELEEAAKASAPEPK